MATSETTTTKQPAPAGGTSPGNYFVSNYPPFSLWKPEFVQEAYATFARPCRPGTPLGIYVHIPFCRKRCHFCYFKVYTGKNSSEIQRYVEAVLKEHALYARQPFISGRKPSFIYFGGGTPSFLSQEQLKSLTDRMKQLLPWDEAEEVTFECEPGTLNPKKLQAIRDIGVTRLSLGVESFDEHVLQVNGRAHNAQDIPRSFDAARAAGFPQINIDLIAGMLDETEETWQDAVRKTVEMQPDSVTIYQMEIPFNTTIFKQMKEKGDLVAPVPDWPTKREWVRYAFAELETAGYTVSSGYTVVKDPARTKFVYRDRLWTGADLVGLGVASFSHVNGTHFQNDKEFQKYIGRLSAGELPLQRALTLTEEERPIRELILQLKLGKVSCAYFQDKFGLDLFERFAEPLRRLEEAGILSRQNGSVVVSRDGLLEVDSFLHEFFLPQHRNLRYT